MEGRFFVTRDNRGNDSRDSKHSRSKVSPVFAGRLEHMPRSLTVESDTLQGSILT